MTLIVEIFTYVAIAIISSAIGACVGCVIGLWMGSHYVVRPVRSTRIIGENFDG